MGAQAERLTLRVDAANWSPYAQACFERACVHASADDLRRQLQRGAMLYDVSVDGRRIGCYLLRRDGQDGVVVAAAGDGGGEVDLVAAILPLIEAQLSDCHGIRVHTSRPGIVRRLAAAGFEPREIVLWKGL